MRGIGQSSYSTLAQLTTAFAMVAGVFALPLDPSASAAGPSTVERRVVSAADDVEEAVATGNVSFSSSDLELVDGGNRGDQVVGVRFTGVSVPRGAHIEAAYVQFQTDEQSTDPTSLTIAAQASDDAGAFTSSQFDVSMRPRTAAAVTWDPPEWTSVGEAGPDQRTPSLADVVQEVVDRPGWVSGNSLAVIVEGAGKRTAEAYDGVPGAAPLLHIEYSTAVSVEAVDDLAAEGTVDQGVIRFTRSAPFDAQLTVTYSVSGSASPGSDYLALPGSLVIPTGEAFVDVTVDPLDDAEVEGNETVDVTVDPGSGYSTGSSPSATVTISDDDTPTISVTASDGTATEGADPPDEAQFTLTRAGPTGQELVVHYIMRGDALPGTDYVAPSAAVTIPAGEVDASVEITPLDDLGSEPNETISLEVTPGSGYAVGDPSTATATLIDNDPIADIPIAAADDDAEEHLTGSVRLFSGDLEMIHDPTNGDQTVGLRFIVPAPQGAVITAAWIQFQAQGVDLDPADLLIEAEAADDAPAFDNTSFGISSRPRTVASVSWTPPQWDMAREAGPDQRTPDLSPVVQEIVGRTGWTQGNSVVFIVTGSGKRVAESFDSDPAAAPILHLEYSGAEAPTNAAPLVEARGDSAVFPAAANLGGSVSDDQLPDPAGSPTTTWSKVSGPGTVTFANPGSVDTTATFSVPGEYVLRLSADDGELVSSDAVLLASADPNAPEPTRIRAAAFGDYGVGCCGEADVANLVGSLAPDLIITTGDNRYVNDMDYAVGQFYADYVANYHGAYGLGSAVNRFFPTPGNHDYSEVGGIDVYLDYFSLPGGTIETSGTSGNERYYDFVYGPVHFFVINSDPNEPDGRTSTSAQALWLQSQLAASNSPWQIVYMHHPPYSSGGTHGSELEMQWPYEMWGADAVLAGHDHVYERIVKGTFPYFVIGNGGAGLASANPNTDPDSQALYDADHGTVLIDACAASLTFEFHSVSEGLLDSYSLGAPSCVAGSPPVANDDSASTPEDVATTTDVVANDTDVDGNLDPATVTLDTPAVSGEVASNGDGTVTYTPEPDFSGTDAYVYEVCDTGGLCDTATVTITVDPVADPPVANDDSSTTSEDTAVNIDVLSNDIDVDSPSLSVISTTQPDSGTAVVETDDTITYTPDPDFNGIDTFTYNAGDGGSGSGPATVTVTVDPVADPPVANDDSATTSEDTPVDIDVLSNDTDPDDDLDRTTLQLTVAPTRGIATINADETINYAPDPGVTGSDAFTYQVCDTSTSCDTALVTVDVGAVNDPPTAIDDSVITDEDNAVTFDPLANDTDPESALDRTSTNTDCAGCSTPANGSLANHGDGTFTYTPHPDFNGADTYTYQVCDFGALCDTGAVTITVTPVADAPVAGDDSATTSEDTSVDIDVLSNDTDVDGDILAVTNLTQPSNGTVTLQPDDTITYIPDPDFNGSDTFTYTANDGTVDSSPAAVAVTVDPVNDPPTANDDEDITDEDAPLSTDVMTNDSDRDDGLDPTTLRVTVAPANGSAVVAPDDTITYTPEPDFNGTDAYVYEVCDTGGLCDTATVTITVDPVADPPVANDDSSTTSEDTAVNIDVLSNDTDVEGEIDPFTLQLIVLPADGSAVIQPDGTITYTPDPGTSGADTFTYEVCDLTALCDTAVVTVTVQSSQMTIEQFAVLEATIEGSVTGSLNDTLVGDGVYEQITEVHSGGPPGNRQSFAEHRWTFDIQRGVAIEVTAEAYHSANSESDDFRFEYSSNGGASFQPLFTVRATDVPGSYTAPLPAVINGEVIVRALDTDRTPGNGKTDTLFVDLLVIRTTNPQAPLPTVTVTATDDTATESGDIGTFAIQRDDTNGPLTVGFTLGGTATEVDDYSALGTSVTFNDGQADVTLTVSPIEDGAAEGAESVELSLDAGATYQRGTASVATVTIIDDDATGTEARATAETTQAGVVTSGEYTSTHFADGVSEEIQEELYAGRKRSRLEHTWTFAVADGSTVTFHLLANHVGLETFTFAFSTDGGGSWTAMPVSATGTMQTVTLPASVQGTVLVRVTDNDQSKDETTIDRVTIDEMYFLSLP